MPERVNGITKTALWEAWKQVRRELRQSTVRDVVDHLEFDIEPNVWIRRLLRRVEAGTYEPATTTRFTLAKSKGFSRTITVPAISDLVLYRAIVDHLYAKSRRRQKRHVYFEVSKLNKATADAAAQAKKEMLYASASRRRFLAWLRYDQYRKLLIFRRVYRYIVVTDITNYFDSILHRRLSEAFHAIAAPRGMLGLLFFLLERLSIRDPYGESPAIGLPVDEFDCSRRLAHVFLYPHDDRMVAEVGEAAYIRWMDDQNLGVPSRAEGLRVLAKLGASLAQLHLTPNVGKTRLLTIPEARRHFHLDLNAALDKISAMPTKTRRNRAAVRGQLRVFWSRARRQEGIGEWEKILKRTYRLAGLASSTILRARAKSDVLQHPALTERIAGYYRCSGTHASYLTFVESIWSDDEQVYDDVNLVLLDSLLRVEAKGTIATRIRRLGVDVLRGKWNYPGSIQAGAIAPLLVLRFGDKRSLRVLRACFEKRLDELPFATVRAAAIVYASYGITEFRTVRGAAARLHRNVLAEIIRLVERIQEYKAVPGSYKQRMNARFDSVAGISFIDMRSLVTARLLSLNDKKGVKAALAAKKVEWKQGGVSKFDQALMKRLL